MNAHQPTAPSFKHPIYRLECKSFTHDYNLGKLAYLSHESCAEDYEISTIEALKNEGIISPENLFSIEDIHGNGLIIPSNIMIMLEALRTKIIEGISEQLFKINHDREEVKANQIIFEYIHPLGMNRSFNLYCVYRVTGITTAYEILITYTGLDISLVVPTLIFSLPNFERFLREFFPCVGLYTSNYAVSNYALSSDYKKVRSKINRSLFNDIIVTKHFQHFINDHRIITKA